MTREEMLQDMDIETVLFGTFLAFNNRLQAAGDTFYEEITCKQFFALICLSLFKEEAPTMNQLSEVMGSSHQNVKQIVNKLERNGFVSIDRDKQDRRKQRITKTEKMERLAEIYRLEEMIFMERFYEGVTTEEMELVYKVLTKLEHNLVKIKEEF